MLWKRFYFFFLLPVRFFGFSPHFLIQRSIPIVKRHGEKYNIDESHNHLHSLEVVHYCMELMNVEKDLTKQEKKIAILGSLFHDTIDSKYVGDEGSDEMMRELLHQVVGKRDTCVDSVILFSKYLSYSKTVFRRDDGSQYFKLPSEVKGHPQLRAYHMIRNADLLSSYNLKRCIVYRSFKNETQDTNVLFSEMSELYWRRMYCLRKYNILSLQNAYCDIASTIMEKQASQRILNYKKWNDNGNQLTYDEFVSYFEIKF